MTGLMISLLFALFLAISPALAFVEKLGPNKPDDDGIPCHAIGAMLRFYIAPDGPVAAVLGNIIEREWVPEGWSAQDIADNQALITIIDGLSAMNKEVAVNRVEDFCILWELDVDELNSPAEYRTRLGLPAAQ